MNPLIIAQLVVQSVEAAVKIRDMVRSGQVTVSDADFVELHKMTTYSAEDALTKAGGSPKP